MNTILVTGATGNVGRPLVSALAANGAAVRALTRHPQAARLPAGVQAVTSVREGLRGASAVFLNSRALGAELDDAVATASREGVTRLVALSAINADDDFSRQPSRTRGDRNREVEQVAVASGLQWVSLRPTVFVSNFVGMWAPQIRAGDVVAGPVPTASTAPIAENDIADVAVRALLTDDLVGRRVVLTGPQAYTNTELVAIIGGALNRSLSYREIPAPEVRGRFAAMGFPAEFADAYVAMLSASTQRPALVTGEVATVTGRPATSFADAIRARRRLLT